MKIHPTRALLLAALLAAPAVAEMPTAQPAAGEPATVTATMPATMPTTSAADALKPEGDVKSKVEETSVMGGGKLFTPATPANITDVTKNVFPAVVSIEVKQETFRGGKRELQGAIGSGMIIDQEGHILTNYHVAGRAAELYVTLANKERIPAKLIGDDHWTDVAIIQMDMAEVRKRKITFQHAQLGSSNNLVPGQSVAAIGTPFGLARTFTLGVVSNTDRTFYPQRQTIPEREREGITDVEPIAQYETGEFANWIQMDTPIAPGNSGGPLVDMNAMIVGINTRGAGGYNLNFAIPIDTAKRVAAEILRTATDAKRGKVERADLGIDLKPLQDLESFYGIDLNKGVLINSVDRDSPAAKAGMRPQDILLTLGGKPTNVRFPEELAPVRERIASLPIGKPVSITVRRGRETMDLTATTQKLEGAVGEQRDLTVWGTNVRDVTRTYANDAQLDDDTGVVITSIRSGYPADKAELQIGDVIRSVDRKPATDFDAFLDLYNAGVEKKEKKVLLEVQRDRGRRTVILTVIY